jgi:hypothetical protein
MKNFYGSRNEYDVQYWLIDFVLCVFLVEGVVCLVGGIIISYLLIEISFV